MLSRQLCLAFLHLDVRVAQDLCQLEKARQAPKDAQSFSYCRLNLREEFIVRPLGDMPSLSAETFARSAAV
jgi:hypothetical protein